MGIGIPEENIMCKYETKAKDVFTTAGIIYVIAVGFAFVATYLLMGAIG